MTDPDEVKYLREELDSKEAELADLADAVKRATFLRGQIEKLKDEILEIEDPDAYAAKIEDREAERAYRKRQYLGTEQRIKQIEALLDADETLTNAEISEQLMISPQRVSQIRRRIGRGSGRRSPGSS